MKSRTLLVAAICLLSVTAGFSQETKVFSPFQFSFIYPAGTSGLHSINLCYGFSLNALVGCTGGIKGCEIGGLANINKSDIAGLQVAGLLNITNGNASGIQVGGLLSNAYNINGIQLNGIAGRANDVKGVQVSGIISLSNSANVSISGIANINTGTVKGIQVGGIFNQTKELNGVQIGLINRADTVIKGVSIGLINIVNRGFYDEFAIYVSDYVNFGMSYKCGRKAFYNIYSIGMNAMQEHLWVTGFGFGHLRELNSKYAFQPEIMYYTYFPADFRHIRDVHTLHFKFGLVRNLNEKYAISFAPSIYAGLKSDEGFYPEYGYEISPIDPMVNILPNWSNTRIEIGFGLCLALSIK